jgi:hypothetical protein
MNGRRTNLDHRFVEFIPRDLEPGIVYVSVEYATVVHACACGCGERVVTALSPVDWLLTYDGAAISLRPSIGNWSLPCRSHYWITANRVEWAGSWSPRQVELARQRDRRDRERWFQGESPRPVDLPAVGDEVSTRGIWHRAIDRLLGRSPR